ncbi:LysM domain-containing protein [Filimonas lacunae]|uniref:Peptidoglycan hydrolase n=1 Tax=Filimonas lacunae TaxID=477680 RepID=A0A173MM89_9BACT|nr:glucosaminidase domain-containing protein [Filimonas lacunae]BAV08580.1 mannosyl-glycoprotein endo-beta-N-acetylglucosamidase [Filimonas lacunae]SIS57588.1 LysM domain-containing protein [Filimonas lacunae]
MKKLICVACAVGMFQFGKAQQPTAAANYVASYKDLAMKEMIRTGVPASITLAQGILETESGQSDLVKASNNHFGIKCKTEWTGAKVYHDDDAKGECFRSYTSAEDSYKDHSDFLRNRPNYAFLFQLDATNYEGWAKGLRKAGYATNPTYAQMLIKIIVDNNLQQYTLLAMNKPGEVSNGTDFFAAHKPQPKNGSVAADKTADNTLEEDKSATAPPAQTVKIAQTIVAAPSYPTGTFRINETSVMYADAGVSLFALANNHNITYKKLLEFNELDNVDILENASLIFLEKKPRKGTKDVHVAEPGETIELIAQKEGVRLESLLLYNRINRNKALQAGDKIYLRANAPVTAPAASKAAQPAKTGHTA